MLLLLLLLLLLPRGLFDETEGLLGISASFAI
jgi:hypothetical protein